MRDLLQAAQTATPSYFKEHLSVPFVLEHEGHQIVQKGDKLAVVCPFHDDSDPSLDIWNEADRGWRWKCFPCGKGGDVLDLLGEIYGLGFSEQLDKASEMLEEMPYGWTCSVQPRPRKKWDTEAEQQTVSLAQAQDNGPLYEFLSKKDMDVDPEALWEEWRLGVRGSEIVIPYYNRQGDLVAWKHRTSDSPALSAPGSTLRGVLYGEWRDQDPDCAVLLCEGESDAWTAWSAGTGHCVLALPSAGAMPGEVTVAPLAGRRVILAFDGDKAGRSSTEVWSKALLEAGCSVEFLSVPDGYDLRTMPDLREALTATRTLKPSPPTVKEVGDTYVRPGKDTNTMLTNWRLEPELELATDEGTTAYAGTLIPTGRKVTLASYDLSSKARIVSWCSRYGVSWMASDRDAQALLAYLQAKGPYLASGRLVDVAGLHTDEFVWPGGRTGDSNLVYAPPQYDVHLEQRLSLDKAEWTPLQVTELRSLHEHRVTDPIIGWLAAAPLRSLLPSFPTLAVTGASGSGKTTLLQTLITAFSGADISTNLTSTTKHALASFLACTNAFPVWFDEYRPGARKDTQMALEQLLRDAYTAQISAKGGLGEHWSEISAMQTHAPIVVSGEDTFTETSHTERMVNLPLPSAGKDPAALSRVTRWGPTGLPRAYLDWLAPRLRAGEFSLEPQPAGAATLPGRQRANLGTVVWGWKMLDTFCQDNGLDPLGPPDLSLVEQAGEEAAAHNPIKDAILWALDEVECYSFIQQKDGMVFIRIPSFVSFIERSNVFQLPGRSAAVDRYVRDAYAAKETAFPFSGKEAACLAFAKSLLD